MLSQRLVLLALLMLTTRPAWAQTRLIDSLNAALTAHPAQDTTRVNQLNRLAYALRFDQPNQVIQVGLKALGLARQLHYRSGEANALFVVGVGHNERTAYLIARQYLDQAQQVYRQLNDRAGQVNVRSQLGWLYTERGDYVPALTFSLQAQQLATQTRNKALIAHTTARLGSIYVLLGDFPQGLKYLTTAIQLYEQAHDETGLCRQLNTLGELYRSQGDFARAARYYNKSIRLADDLDSPYLVAEAESNLAAVLVEQQDYPSALTTARHALGIIKSSHDNGIVAWLQTVLARAHLQSGRADSAVIYGQRSWRLGQRIGYRETMRDASEVLAQAYAQQRNFSEAYQFQRAYTAYNDTLVGRSTQRQTAVLQYNYGLAEKQAQISSLQKERALQAEASQKQRQLLIGTGVGLVLIFGLLLIAYRNNRLKQRANALLQQQKAEIQAQRDQIDTALTELKTTQTQLIQSEKMASLGELTAGIAHEIQNPLNFVNNFSEVSVELIDELADEQHKPTRDPDLEADLLSDLKQNLQKISHHGGRASSIVRGMLQHSRASTGQREPTDLNALCDEYLRLAYHGLRAKDKTFNASFSTDLDSSLGLITVVAQDLGRVLLNLSTNAFYAVQQRQKQADITAYQPTVSVSTKRLADGQVEIRVTDNGTGMPESVKAKIFQPFFTTKPTGEGTGLGLSLAYDIITNGHGGTLTVNSREGEGTEFMIRLPA